MRDLEGAERAGKPSSSPLPNMGGGGVFVPDSDTPRRRTDNRSTECDFDPGTECVGCTRMSQGSGGGSVSVIPGKTRKDFPRGTRRSPRELHGVCIGVSCTA